MTGKAKRLLFVCTGNTCRSPMAAALFSRLAQDRGVPAEARSAGTAALPGTGAAEDAVTVLRDRGIDLSRHRAQRLTDRMVAESDLVLTMTREQKSAVLRLIPAAAGKVFTLKEYAEPELWRQLAAEAQDAYDELAHRQAEYRRALAQQGGSEGRGPVPTRVREEEPEAVREQRARLSALDSRLREMDVPDPLGQPIEAYRLLSEELERYVGAILDRLQAEARDGSSPTDRGGAKGAGDESGPDA